MFDRWSMIIVLYFLFHKDKYHVHNVDRWSMISILHMCVFQSSYLVLNVWHIFIPSFFMFVYSRHKYSVNISSLIIVLHLCVFQRYIPCPSCSLYHVWPSFSMLVYSRDKFLVLNIRHIIYNRHKLCLCLPEINTVSVIFDKSSMLIVAYVCVINSSISFLIVRHIIHDHPTKSLCFPELNNVSLLFYTCSYPISQAKLWLWAWFNITKLLANLLTKPSIFLLLW